MRRWKSANSRSWLRFQLITRENNARNKKYQMAAFIAVCLVVLFDPSVAHADAELSLLRDGMIFESLSKTASAVISGSASMFSVFVGKKKRYTSPPDPSLRFSTLFISDDGDTVVRMLPDRFVSTTETDIEKRGALVFYQKGLPIRQYLLQELLVRSQLVSYSTSHTLWIMESRRSDWSPGPPKLTFAPDGSRLEFETTSFRHYVFDPKTGAALVAEDSDIWKKADLILYADIKNLKENQPPPPRVTIWESQRYRILKGDPKMKERIRFEDPTQSYLRSGWTAVALKKTAQGWVATVPAYQIPVMYNALP